MALKIRVHERLHEAFIPKTVKIGDQVWTANDLTSYDLLNNRKGLSRKINDFLHDLAYETRYFSKTEVESIVADLKGWHIPTFEEWKLALDSTGTTEEDCRKLAKTLNLTGAGQLQWGDHISSKGYSMYWSIDNKGALSAVTLDNYYGSSILSKNRYYLITFRDGCPTSSLPIRLIKD